MNVTLLPVFSQRPATPCSPEVRGLMLAYSLRQARRAGAWLPWKKSVLSLKARGPQRPDIPAAGRKPGTVCPVSSVGATTRQGIARYKFC